MIPFLFFIQSFCCPFTTELVGLLRCCVETACISWHLQIIKNGLEVAGGWQRQRRKDEEVRE